MLKNVKARLQIRADSKENWESVNPILLLNELVAETQSDGNFKFKLGNGTDNYIDLKYFSTEQPVDIFNCNLSVESWSEHQTGVWKQTVTNENIKSAYHISIEASASEFISHMNDIPITNLVVGNPSDGSVDIYAISDEKPHKIYNIKLIMHNCNIIN